MLDTKKSLENKMIRSNVCGELTEINLNQTVTLCGWVNKTRDLGRLFFIDLRDKYGMTQINLSALKEDAETSAILKKCSLESVIKIDGIVKLRPVEAQNKNMVTGMIEIEAKNIELLSQSDIDNLPFLPNAKIEATDNLKLKYRYLDLRTQKLQRVLKVRSDLNQKLRKTLIDEGFIEVETPILYKSTPEGARDYIVPSRVQTSKVYALPQSPQTLKQLLMIGGTDKYFQICRCFRDEDLRSDRQPEFTQLDVEASFITAKYSKFLVEKILINLFELDKNFSLPVLSFQDAMDRYGSDKPDIRFGLEHMDFSDVFKESLFPKFKEVMQNKDNNIIKGLFLPESIGVMTRKQIDYLNEVVKPFNVGSVYIVKFDSVKTSSGISKFIQEDELSKILEIKNNIKSYKEESNKGIFIFVIGAKEKTNAALDSIRRHLAKTFIKFGSEKKFLWVNDFPLLEWDDTANRFMAKHHPFTMPRKDWVDRFIKGDREELKNCVADAYDLVCNGYEVAGGSLRIYRNDIQSQMFKVLGFSEEEANQQFGFFLEALKFGVPPHGGFAFGIDRLMMIIEGTEFIKDVIAFPKTNSATDLMSNSPSAPSKSQLKELNFSWNK